MKINPVNKIAIVNELTNVETQAVSLVNYGANEQGFKIVKTLDGYNLNSKRLFDSKGDFLMAVSPERIEFDVNVFPTVEKVEEYLKSHNYDQVTIVEKTGVFVAFDSGSEIDLETGEPLIMEDGVTAFVVETEDSSSEEIVDKSVDQIEEPIEEPQADCVETEALPEDHQGVETADVTDTVVAEEVKEVKEIEATTTSSDEVVEEPITEVAKTDELKEVETEHIKKFDYWASYDKTDGDFLKSVRAGVDKGLPPSFEYVSELFTKTQIQAIVKGQKDLYDKNCRDYLKYMTAMLQVYTDVVDMAEPEVVQPATVEMTYSDKSTDKLTSEAMDKYDEVFKKLAELEIKISEVQAEKKTVEVELEKSKQQLDEMLEKSKEIEKQLDDQEVVETTIQKRKVVGVVAHAPVKSPKLTIFAMGEHGTLRPV